MWIYNNNIVNEDDIKDYYGFTYIIYDKVNEKCYVGKKAFNHKLKRKITKKEKTLPENKRKKIVNTTKSSGWQNYFGSSKNLLEQVKIHGKENFKRVILEFAINKSDLALKEIEAQIKYNVLRIDSYNLWIGGRVYKRYL